MADNRPFIKPRLFKTKIGRKSYWGARTNGPGLVEYGLTPIEAWLNFANRSIYILGNGYYCGKV